MKLGDCPSLASDWKLDISALKIRDFRERLDKLIQRALVAAVIRNRWWGSLEHRIRDFTVKYCQKLALNNAKTGFLRG